MRSTAIHHHDAVPARGHCRVIGVENRPARHHRLSRREVGWQQGQAGPASALRVEALGAEQQPRAIRRDVQPGIRPAGQCIQRRADVLGRGPILRRQPVHLPIQQVGNVAGLGRRRHGR